MGKIKETEYTNYDDKLLNDEEDFIDPDMTDEDEDGLLADQDPGYKRTWRDAEKYKEMRKLYKIINDDLYTGFDEEEFHDIDEQ